MSSDFESGTRKMIDLTIKAEHLTSDILKSAMNDFLNGNAEKKGKITLNQLAKQSGGKLENIEVAKENIADFLDVARKYAVDFAIRASPAENEYHVFFSAGKTDDVKRAFAEYASLKNTQLVPNQAEITRQELREQYQQLRNEPSQHKHKERVKKRETAL
ncbi:MAG: PcfB family protein [Oscillospiraceae bacterium]|nr:PcfB family protein [Oscillospiraceae bacterium]